MLEVLQVAAIILSAVTMTLALAHLLEWPGKMRLTRDQYLAVQPIYYPGFTFAGAAEPLTILVLASLLVLTPSGTTTFRLTLFSLAAAVLTHLLYWLLTAPVNKVWLKDEKLSRSAQRFFDAGADTNETQDWTILRDRWERSHAYRAVTAMTAFVLIVIAAVGTD
jgi:hypothetical protein